MGGRVEKFVDSGENPEGAALAGLSLFSAVLGRVFSASQGTLRSKGGWAKGEWLPTPIKEREFGSKEAMKGDFVAVA